MNKKMYPTFIYSYSGSATIPLKPPSLENLPANSSIVLFWYTYKTIILLPVFLILGRIPLSTAPAGLPNNRQLILKKVTVWMIHHLRYLVTFALSHEETPEADPGDGGQRDLVQESKERIDLGPLLLLRAVALVWHSDRDQHGQQEARDWVGAGLISDLLDLWNNLKPVF